jgi:hypothetical protein
MTLVVFTLYHYIGYYSIKFLFKAYIMLVLITIVIIFHCLQNCKILRVIQVSLQVQLEHPLRDFAEFFT